MLLFKEDYRNKKLTQALLVKGLMMPLKREALFQIIAWSL
jgi:hypothetical protein